MGIADDARPHGRGHDRRMKILPALAIAAAASAALAGPAGAKTTTYTGKTTGGNKITLKVSGTKVTKIDTMLPSTCVATTGVPRAGADFYRPPGAFTLNGVKQKASELQESAMHYAEVTKNYHFTARRRNARTISGKLHMNFSFLTLSFNTWGTPGTIPWICQGDGTFTARAR